MENVESILPLSPMQLDILLRGLHAPEMHEYVEQMCWTARGAFHPAAFAAAWRDTVARHPVLRTAFFHEGMAEPVQVVRREVQVQVEAEDWRALSGAEQEARFRRLLADDRARDFALTAAPLLRVCHVRTEDESWRFVWSYHHLVLDGWSAALCLRDVFAAYREHAEGVPRRAEPAPPFSHYLAWLARQDLAACEEFWRAGLDGFRGAAALPAPAPGATGQGRVSAVVPAALSGALRSMARRHHLSLATLFEGAWALLLARRAGTDDVVYGSVGSGRPAELPGADAMIGLFVRTAPTRARVAPGEPVHAWLAALQRGQREARRFDFARLTDVARWGGVPRGRRLFEHLFVFQNLPDVQTTEARVGALEISGLERVRTADGLGHALMLMVHPHPEIGVDVAFGAGWDAASAGRLLGEYRALLEAMVAGPERPVDTLGAAEGEALRRVLAAGTGESPAYPRDATVHGTFAGVAARAPDAVALVWDGGRMTYGELLARALALAGRLRAAGVEPDAPVAVLLERSPGAVVALLAVLMAGGAYLPLDPAYPAERIALLLEDGGARVVVAGSGARVPAGVRVVEADGPAGAEAPPATGPASGAAYVLYTSGSTGRPKGVVVTHRAVLRLVLGADFARFGAEECWLQLAPLSFDASTLEVWGALLNGGRLALFPPLPPEPRELGAFIARHGVTSAWLTAGLFHQVADSAPEALAGVRQLLAGGDVLSPSHVRRALRANPGMRLVNGYGPTENTTFSCCHTIRPEDAEGESIPIGRPIAHSRAYVLDAALRPLPPEAPGELFVAGDGLARGYLGAPGLTAPRFVPDPFAGEPGARMYRTGDRARWRADGVLEFMGRLDEQVKVRGFRIEPGEVEAALRAHPAVAEAAVAVHEAGEAKRLVAYVVPRGTVDAPTLRAYAAARVPEFMVPGAWVWMDALPLTPNGKVDRRALPDPGAGGGIHAPYAAPANEVEERVAEVWAEVLSLPRVGIHDRFLEVGGDSLAAMRVVGRLRAEFEVDLPADTLFHHSTVAAVAELVLARLLGEVAALSDAEAMERL